MDPKVKGEKRRPRRGRMLLVAGAGLASVIGLTTACGVTVHGIAPCDEGAEGCGPFGTVVAPEDAGSDAGRDAGVDAGEDAGTDGGGPDASGPFGLFPPDGGADGG
jgi:hypothetical protein